MHESKHVSPCLTIRTSQKLGISNAWQQEDLYKSIIMHCFHEFILWNHMSLSCFLHFLTATRVYISGSTKIHHDHQLPSCSKMSAEGAAWENGQVLRFFLETRFVHQQTLRLISRLIGATWWRPSTKLRLQSNWPSSTYEYDIPRI